MQQDDSDQDSQPITKSVSRRRFASGTLAMAAGGAALSKAHAAPDAGASDKPSKPWDYDVIVVGGGNAGVAAARDCMKNGYTTLLLEASNRLGGRTFSSTFEGVPVELGGTWIHHTQPYVWAEKERYNLALEETPGGVPDAMILIMDGKRIELTLEQFEEVALGWQTYNAAAREIIPRAWDILYNREAALAADRINAIEHLDSLDLTPLQRGFNRAFIAAMAHNQPEEMSYLEVMRWHLVGGGYFPTFMDSVARFKLKDGTIALIDKMMEDGKPELRLATPVAAIRDAGEMAVVTTLRKEKITAGAVITCLPMNTIHRIQFDPALPAGVVEAGQARHTGAGIKLYMKVEGDVGNVAIVAENAPIDYLMTYKQNADYTLLVGFGKDPEELDAYDDDAVQAALQMLLPGAKLLSTMHYDWNNDPNAAGTYASYKPGWVNKYYDVFQKDQGRVLFGSSDHGEGWRGFIDGAIGGGIKAAHRAKVLLG